MTAALANAKKKYFIVELPNLSTAEKSADLESVIKQSLLEPIEIFVLDFNASFNIHQTNLNQIMSFQQTLKKAKKQVFSVNLKSQLHMDLLAKGVLQSLGFANSLEEIEKRISPPANVDKIKKFNTDVVKQFVEAASKAFAVQAKTVIKVASINNKKHLYESDDEVVGSIEVATDGFAGHVAICLSQNVFIKIYKVLLDEEISAVNSDNIDMVSEFLNMIYGQVKTSLNATMGLTLKPALPIAQLKPGIKAIPKNSNVIAIHFDSDLGKLRIDVQLN